MRMKFGDLVDGQAFRLGTGGRTWVRVGGASGACLGLLDEAGRPRLGAFDCDEEVVTLTVPAPTFLHQLEDGERFRLSPSSNTFMRIHFPHWVSFKAVRNGNLPVLNLEAGELVQMSPDTEVIKVES